MKKILENKTSRYLITGIVTVALLIAMSLVIFDAVNKAMSIGSGGTVTETRHDNDLYTLNSNATDYQKEIYKQLSEYINNGEDDQYIADYAVRSFIADFFTWTNKEGSYDVGGLQYVFSGERVYVFNQARDGFYYYLSYYLSEYGNEDLLQVKNINTSIVYGGPHNYGGVDFKNCYYVEATWEYEDSSVLDTKNFQNFAAVNVVLTDDGRYEIVNFYD